MGGGVCGRALEQGALCDRLRCESLGQLGGVIGTFLSILTFFFFFSLFIQYRVWDPTHGFHTVIDPQDLIASPLGWHSDGTTNTTVTT